MIDRILILLVVGLIVFILWKMVCSNSNPINNVLRSTHTATDVDDETLNNLKARVLVILEPTTDREFFSDPLKIEKWPWYIHTYPYRKNRNSGEWPSESTYSRLRFWSPNFYTVGSGWQYYKRPGVDFKYYQRGYWIRNNGKYFYVSNADDYKHDAANYSNLPFSYQKV